MKSKIVSTLGAAALALSMSASLSYAGYMQPGETMGVSLLSPLPEGVFFADLEDYGRSQLAPGPKTGLGVNIPVIIWSTPVSFYNTRLEFIAATPFAHLDGNGLDRTGFITQGYGVLLGHDFGGGLTGGVGALFRTPDPSSNIEDLSGRTRSAIDVRESLQYKVPTGPFAGITLIQNAAYTTNFQHVGPTSISSDGLVTGVQNDLFAGDFTAEKTFGKFTIGFTGYGNIDTNNQARLTIAGTNGNTRERNVAVGGLVAYDFGKFTLTGIVTHSLMRNAIVPSVSVGEETRGWVRIIVPLYVAPAAPAPVVARY